MQSYSFESYGQAMAPVFDAINDDPEEVAAIVAFLRARAGDGPVLEAGIGTGRVGLPLAEAGVELHGVEISEAMAEQLRAKPGADKVELVVGDMNEVDLGREFSMVYLVQGTFGSLLSEENQRRFLATAHRLLAPGGRLVIETMEVDETRFTHDQYVATSLLDVGYAVLSAAMREPGTQVLSIQNIMLGAHGIQVFPVKFRYYTAEQLDGMAEDTGFTLVERCVDWGASPYEKGDLNHVSVFEKR
ncbi:class I SAM-dependent DNA methyltransferase [Actinosynnema pretiosum]|uniref:SAM-dependent methyltransferase n=1 Tax=Actinosynnema pretiosum TaxID=42197 RepID=A0A290Z7L3_9PSEU|nr:class I SAM-dependent methyltransferase [Actinosynnema pretiosum]ATE55017.1 SAM-dependent methyltransferase [Actinosynnema pretiosum]